MSLLYVEGAGGVRIGGNPTVVFTPGLPEQVSSDVVFEWDFDNDGLFTQDVEDITSYVQEAQLLVGRDQPSEVNGTAVPGRMKLTLDNSDDRFSFFNASSPLTQDGNTLRSGRRLRVRKSALAPVLDVTGASGSYASTPDAAAFDITGDISLRGTWRADDWATGTAQTLIAKWVTTGNQRSYLFQVSATGFPRVFTSPDGTSAAQVAFTATRAVPAADGALCFLRVDVDVDNGASGKTATFYYALHPQNDIWIQLGDPVTVGGGTTSIFSSTAPVMLGAFDTGGTQERLNGQVIRSQILNSSSAEVADVEFPVVAEVGDTTVVDETGNTWTVQGAASIIEADLFVEPGATLIAQDRMNRPSDDFIGQLETGQTYDEPFANDFVILNRRAVAGAEGSESMAVVDTGVTDYYVQVRVVQPGRSTDGATDNEAGVVYRYQDGNDYSVFRVNTAGLLEVVDVVAGVETVLDSTGVEPVDQMTLGVLVRGSSVMCFYDGVALTSVSSTAIQLDETHVGFHALWGTGNDRPAFDSFYVWDRLPVHLDAQPTGVLATMTVQDVMPSVADRVKQVEVTCEGDLSRLAGLDVRPPRFASSQGAGFLAGKILANAGALQPPASIDAIDGGTFATGPIHNNDTRADALELLRPVEVLERGHLWERPEGGIAFDSAESRSLTSVKATFSDAEGAQYAPDSIELLGWRNEIVNRAEPGLAGAFPQITASSFENNETPGTPNPVSITLPVDTQDGDLFVAICTSSVADADEEWVEPIYWVEERNMGSQVRQRVYTRVDNGTGGGSSFTFYDDALSSGGAWIVTLLQIRRWYGNHDGIDVGRWAGPTDPPALEPRWGSAPTAYIVMRMGARGAGAKTVTGTVWPIGFQELDIETQAGTTLPFSVAQMVGVRNSTEPRMDPSAFSGTFTGYQEVECGIMAVRGFNGDDPDPDAPERLQFDDLASQDEQAAVRPFPDPPVVFADEEAAEEWSSFVLDRHATDRPHLRVRFTATKAAHWRSLATKLRLGDKVAVVTQAESGLGATGDYFIETRADQWLEGNTLWKVELDLAPVD